MNPVRDWELAGLRVGVRVAKRLRVALEVGPKGKKVVAVAPDWPGLERGAKTAEAAVVKLQSYLPRYAEVAKLAGLVTQFEGITNFEVVEEYKGIASTDFWGISFAFSSIDSGKISTRELERELGLMQACWTFLDEVRPRVSAELHKGPRGGGRDRDLIYRHVVANEQEWGKKVGVPKEGETVTDDDGVKAHRETYCTAIRSFHSEGKMARNWPLRFLIRHTAYHTMDHAWEMEDKDLTRR
jgi:hypothetical protein